MIQVLGNTILPIFSIILIGYLLNVKRVIDTTFIKPANQIVYYVAIPAMLFNEIARASFKESFHPGAVFCLVGALGLHFILAWGLMKVLNISRNRRGTFLQSSFHGNIGYIAYAMSYYALGEATFALTAILSGFLIIAQNFLAVWILLFYKEGAKAEHPNRVFISSVVHNPVIIAVLAGILYSVSKVPLFTPLQRGLEILSGMALPTALLLIGATLSFGSLRKIAKEVFTIGLLKLILLPLLGYRLMGIIGVPSSFHLPAVILLAAPPATLIYIMATEIGGDPELAATSISVLTLCAALTYTILLSSFTASP